MVKFPAHKAGLHLEHNPHLNFYESVAKYLDQGDGDFYEFRDAESRNRCIDANDIWVLQWYPNTPIGFIAVAAPTFDELMEFANRGGFES